MHYYATILEYINFLILQLVFDKAINCQLSTVNCPEKICNRIWHKFILALVYKNPHVKFEQVPNVKPISPGLGGALDSLYH